VSLPGIAVQALKQQSASPAQKAATSPHPPQCLFPLLATVRQEKPRQQTPVNAHPLPRHVSAQLKLEPPLNWQ
jgi:hypothetical protein